MTFEDIVKIGLELPDVVDGLIWGTPGLKRKKRFMLRLKEDGESLAVKLDWDNHDRLLAAYPNVFFKTSHYEGYPALLVRLDVLDPDLAREIVQLSWQDAPNKAISLPA